MKYVMTSLLTLFLAGTLSLSLAQSDLEGDITVMAWDVAAEALDNLVPGFNEEYPNVNVTVENLGNQQVYDRGLGRLRGRRRGHARRVRRGE